MPTWAANNCAGKVLQSQANVHIRTRNNLFDYSFKDSVKEINVNKSQSIPELMSLRAKASSEISIIYAYCLPTPRQLTINKSQKTMYVWGEKNKQAGNVFWSGQVKITCDLCELWLLPTEIEKCVWKRNEDKAVRDFSWQKYSQCSEQNRDRKQDIERQESKRHQHLACCRQR